MKSHFAGPHVMKDEILDAVKKMESDKAERPDSVSVEPLRALDYEIDRLWRIRML